jgi:hypothetical protein
MTIRTVTNENVGEFVAERQAKGSVMSSAEAPAAPVEGVATPGNPIIKEGVAETLEGTPPAPEVKTPSAKTRPVQPRIDELTREKYELEEFAQNEYESRLSAERRISELEAQIKAKEPPAPVVEELKRPSPKDFTDQDLYDKAMEAYEAKRDERTAARAAAQARQEVLVAEQNRVLASRIEVAKKDLPDFAEVIERADKRTRGDIPNHIKAAIVESEKGAYIAYHLAKNPEEEKRIFALSPAKALMELGRIEDTYAKGTPAPVAAKPNGNPTPETTRAPAPVVSVRGSEGGIVNTDLSKPMGFQDYKQARLEQMRARKRH